MSPPPRALFLTFLSKQIGHACLGLPPFVVSLGLGSGEWECNRAFLLLEIFGVGVGGFRPTLHDCQTFKMVKLRALGSPRAMAQRFLVFLEDPHFRTRRLEGLHLGRPVCFTQRLLSELVLKAVDWPEERQKSIRHNSKFVEINSE